MICQRCNAAAVLLEGVGQPLCLACGWRPARSGLEALRVEWEWEMHGKRGPEPMGATA